MSNARPGGPFKRPLILFRLKIKFAGHARALRDKDRPDRAYAARRPGNRISRKPALRQRARPHSVARTDHFLHRSPAYSALAWMRMGRSGSASFQRVRKF